MKNLIVRLLLICASAFVFAGCVSPRAYSRACTKFPQIATGKGRIYFFRGNDFVGGGQWDIVQLNGDLAGYLSPISFFYLDEAPGSYTVSARPKGWLSKTIGGHQTTFRLDAGKTKYVRLTQKLTHSGTAIGFVTGGIVGAVGAGASPTPGLENRDSAMKVLSKCLYYGGKYHVF